MKVAVIGGDSNEPELRILKSIGAKFDLSLLGVEPRSLFLDLTIENTFIGLENKFDIVLCSQVLEHVYNHENAFILMSRLLRKDGLL